MRYNRIWMTLTLMAVIFVLGGCMNVQDLTEKETSLVAEYSAGVLLRYSDQYERRLITKDPVKEEKTAASTPEPASPAGVSTTPTPEPVSEPEVSQRPDEPETPVPDAQSPASQPSDQVSLNELYHIKGLDFSYRSYEFCDKYPKSGNTISAIKAKKGETLLVVKFLVRNRSGKKKRVRLGDRAQKISYIMTVDGNEYEPGLSILPNTGLNYLNTTIGKGAAEEAVLVYTMAKERQQAASITLQIKEGNNSANIQLK